MQKAQSYVIIKTEREVKGMTMTATREQKEQMLLNIIQKKGFEDENTLWFARMTEMVDDMEHLTLCETIALKTLEEKLRSLL